MADVELLPLPPPGMLHTNEPRQWFTANQMHAYARANMERLRAEVELWRHKAAIHKYRRKRLAEALMEYGLPLTGDDIQDAWEFGDEAVAREKRRRAALAQEDRFLRRSPHG